MTGEMHKSEVTREAFPTHFAIADALNGEVRPFDQYQGPYVSVFGGKLFLQVEDNEVEATVVNTKNGKQSDPFILYVEYTDFVAVEMARTVL